MIEVLGEERIRALIRSFQNECPEQVDIYILGGAAMAIRGEKASTKDVDLVIASTTNVAVVKETLERMGVWVNCSLKDRATGPLNPPTSGITVDLFSNTICGGLSLSHGMISRATPIEVAPSRARFHLLSREDIFLLKSITGRTRDLDEMYALYRRGVNGSVIMEECDRQDSQPCAKGRVWETFLLQRVEELVAMHKILVPWMAELKKRAEIKLGSSLLVRELISSPGTYKEISIRMGITQRSVRDYATYSEAHGLITVDRSKRPHQLTARRDEAQPFV